MGGSTSKPTAPAVATTTQPAAGASSVATTTAPAAAPAAASAVATTATTAAPATNATTTTTTDKRPSPQYAYQPVQTMTFFEYDRPTDRSLIVQSVGVGLLAAVLFESGVRFTSVGQQPDFKRLFSPTKRASMYVIGGFAGFIVSKYCLPPPYPTTYAKQTSDTADATQSSAQQNSSGK